MSDSSRRPLSLQGQLLVVLVVQRAVEGGCHERVGVSCSVTLVPTALFSDRLVDIPVVRQTTRQSGEEQVLRCSSPS